MTEPVRINTGYVPRAWQAFLHPKLKRFNVLVLHRRAGKTVFAINHVILKAFKNKRERPRYAYVAPTYSEAKKIAWDYFKVAAAKFPGVSFNEAELRIDIPLDQSGLNTIRFQLFGAERPESLKGAYYDGIIFDEYAQIHPSAWTESVRPALADRNGWAIFISTPKGKNHFYDMYKKAFNGEREDWFAFMLKSSESGLLSQQELKEIRDDMSSQEEFDQEMECSFESSSVGAYYGADMAAARVQGRIRNIPIDTSIPCRTAWDLGIGDFMAIWIYQKVWKEIHVLKYMEYTGVGFKDVVPILRNLPFTYESHGMPWDIVNRELMTGQRRIDTAQTLGIKPIITAPKLAVQDGIDRVREIFPRCFFDEEGCKDGIDHLTEYKKKWDETNKVFLDKPRHDLHSHGADAFRTLALTVDERREVDKSLPRRAKSEYPIFGGR